MSTVRVTQPYRKRRQYSPEFKAQLVAESQIPGASVARIALDNDLNANLLRRWITESKQSDQQLSPAFVPINLPAAVAPAVKNSNCIRIEIPQPSGPIVVEWPTEQVWAYCTTPFSDLKAVVYNFAPTRAGEHARNFLGDWQGKLVCDDYSGYKAGFGNGITEIGCMAHARRKFYDLHEANQSTLAAQALEYIGQLYMVERETKDLPADKRHAIRYAKARPIADALHQWMLIHRQKVPDGSGTARALDYSLKRWTALTRYLDDGAVPIDKNWVENQIRPWALGRSNWLFAGSLRSGQRAAAVMTLIQSAKLNGHDPYAYLKDVLTRLPMQKSNAIDELLPHNWTPVILSKV